MELRKIRGIETPLTVRVARELDKLIAWHGMAWKAARNCLR